MKMEDLVMKMEDLVMKMEDLVMKMEEEKIDIKLITIRDMEEMIKKDVEKKR